MFYLYNNISAVNLRHALQVATVQSRSYGCTGGTLILRGSLHFCEMLMHTALNNSASTSKLKAGHGMEWNGNLGMECGRCQNGMEWKISRIEWKTIFHTSIPIPSSVARGGLEPPHWLVKYAKSHVFGAFGDDIL